MNAEERIKALRTRCLDRKQASAGWSGWLGGPATVNADSLKASEGMPWQRRCGCRTRDRLVSLQFEIDDLELFAGRIVPPCINAAAEEDAREYLKQYPCAGGQGGHCELDRSRIFDLGIDGLQEDLSRRVGSSEDEGQKQTWESFRDALSGLSGMILHAAEAAERSAAGASSGRRKELAEISASCRRIAHQPPASFRDALQLLWFVDLAVMFGDGAGLVGPGHLDRSLQRFYEQDRADGVLARDEALLLLESLYILINDFVPDGLAMACMVGGRDVDGNDVTNELSYLCLEALRRTRLVYPTVGICWHDGTPQDLLDLGVELVADGLATPAFFGDETIQRGLRDLGLPPAEACHYINSTCVEITPVGSSNVWVASPYYSTCGILLEEIAAQVEDVPAFSFNDFIVSYRERLAEHVATGVEMQNKLRQDRWDYGGRPLQSVFTNDCIERGQDIDRGGARCNWVECSFVGLANLADSLHVIREEVFAQKTMTLAELKEVLDSDFADKEVLRQRLLEGYPKYGNGCVDVDSLLDDIVGFAQDVCGRHRMKPDDSAYVPGAFCWVMHERLGAECGAIPDGRKAGVPFADGCGPAQGREKNGPTAAILSTTSWEHSPMIGGLAYNMKFNRSLFDSSSSVTRLGDLVRTFLDRGGFETQINVVDHDTLKRAKEDPEAYRDLVVRIGGYTDYFVRLTPAMQDEVMRRTEFKEV